MKNVNISIYLPDGGNLQIGDNNSYSSAPRKVYVEDTERVEEQEADSTICHNIISEFIVQGKAMEISHKTDEEVMQDLRTAANKNARTFAEVLHQKMLLGVLNFYGQSTRYIFETLQRELPITKFQYQAFQKAYNATL